MGYLATVHYRLGLTSPKRLGPTPVGTPGGLTYVCHAAFLAMAHYAHALGCKGSDVNCSSSWKVS